MLVAITCMTSWHQIEALKAIEKFQNHERSTAYRDAKLA